MHILINDVFHIFDYQFVPGGWEYMNIVLDFTYTFLLLLVPCVYYLAKAIRKKSRKEIWEWVIVTLAIFIFIVIVYRRL